MRRLLMAGSAALVLAALVACGDKPQSIGDDGKKDVAAFNGTPSPYVAPGWKPGDKSSWEQHLRARLQRGQNDYAKAH